MFDTVVLGIDPGVARVGLAVLGRRDRTTSLLWADTVSTPSGLAEARRLHLIADAVSAAIAEHRPTAVAIERLAWNRNQVSVMQVARATGAVMVAAARAGLPVDEYGPSEVKMAVTGMGNADKEQVRLALSRIHGLRDVPVQPDAADAAAVAFTHVLASRIRSVEKQAAL
jgi:crossover junction endodeoxyribonuclease RuvC